MQKEIGDSAPTFHPNTCPTCRRAVIWAKFRSTLIPVETCADGAGNIGLSTGLFAAPNESPTAEIVATATRYREHRAHCPGQKGRGGGAAGGAFSGQSFSRKKRGPA